jgi:hypothetical protein
MADEEMNLPPELRVAESGAIEPGSLADLVEWFLLYDERTARMRHPMTEELFQWKQKDDEASGIGIYPFENAEARFAIGIFQALDENRTEAALSVWLNDVLTALHDARETRSEMSDTYKLEKKPEASPLEKSEKLTSAVEKRLYLSSFWLETLCTAEVRVLGWIYQELYGKPFSPAGS